MNVERIINEFLFENSSLSYHRLTKYKKVCGLFINYLKNKGVDSIEKITNEHLIEFLNKTYPKGKYKEWTEYTEKRIFRKLIRWLIKRYRLKVDLDVIKIKEVKNNYPIDLISEEEFKLIYNNSKQTYKTIFAILYEIGLRPQEVLNIKMSDVLIGKD